VLALTVTGAAQVVGTLLVLSLAITPAAAAQRLSASPLVIGGLSVLFAVVAADGGLLINFEVSNVKASVFITSLSFTIYLLARLAGPALRGRRHYHHEGHQLRHAAQGASLVPPAAVPGGPADATALEQGASPEGPPARHAQPPDLPE
jgi:hypothetical protein